MDDGELLSPTGFRFHPTEDELVSFYLHHKLNNTKPQINAVIPLLDIYHHHPSDLPKYGGDYSPEDGEQWFFFNQRPEREARGGRPNRLTAQGYWKATGCLGHVYSSGNHRVIGRKRTMVFYDGRAPHGKKTEWKMIEYKAIQAAGPSSSTATPQLREELSLCRIYKSSKCLRAFDRRPPPEAANHHRHGQNEAAKPHCHSQNEAAATRSNAYQNINCNDSSNPFVESENKIDTAIDNILEDLWDYKWNESDWFGG